MNDKTENPAEIYLVADAEHGHVWSDDPAPGEGMREEDATRYVREDIYLALQAQVEQLRKYGNLMCVNLAYSTDAFAEEYRSLWKEAQNKTPAQCLTEIKAQAVEEFCASYEGLAIDQCPTTDECSEDLVTGWKAGNMDCRMAGRKYANQLRQAAKGGE
ncbi:hypothetical protein JAO78_005355 [Alishewanella sp. 16-MA]|uniref:Phage protein n=1 Tax=Alishewanella maricola TaxID=2795740 RepID=A0ABS8C1P3_9ALTE|nr:hypothetical protein [Alishewanella maricola]MCB5226239.1 hypothetical protein [Alishewanella maricola]